MEKNETKKSRKISQSLLHLGEYVKSTYKAMKAKVVF